MQIANDRRHSPDTIRAALTYIPANLIREEWVKIGMAIQSEFPDETGLDLFTEWSATAASFNAKDCRDTWRSFTAGGPVAIGTLLREAKANGFHLPKPDQPAPRLSPEAEALRQREQAEAREREAQAERERHEAAAIDARQQWKAAKPDGTSPYLLRKNAQAHGVRFGADGSVLVPLRDGKGQLWSVQRIAPNGEKRFPKGARKSGLWHLLGTLPAGAGAGPQAAPVLLIAEGYATAASLHEATGYPVAVAFDAGNLAKVASALRDKHPAALIVVCGDDDQATEASKGHNPGKRYATEAAEAVGGVAVFPEGLPEGGSDFNDMHQARGLDAVSLRIAPAIDAAQAARDAWQAKNTTTSTSTKAPASPADPAHKPDTAPGGQGGGRGGNGGRRGGRGGAGAGGGAGGSDRPATPEWDRFQVNDDGVFHHGVDREGRPTEPEWICSRLDVEALTRDESGGNWGYLLNFADPLGNGKTWAMPSRLLASDGGEYRAALMGMGLRIAAGPRARNLLTQYIQTRHPEEHALCTDKTGWHGRAFVLPHETIGKAEGRVVFQTESAMENTYRTRGTLDQWRDRVAALCAGNSRLVFAVACAFAGPVLRPAGVESGGFHFRGDSSSGKTTALRVAASVWGGANYLQRWRATDNALEAIAAQHSDGLLILDELAQVDSRSAGSIAYMLSNESGKSRATRNGAPRARLSWRLLFLSAGEVSLSDHMAESQQRARAGQETRMADIPADAGAGLGAFEDLHGMAGGAVFSSHITGQAGTVYGTAGRAWLEWLTDNADALKARIREGMARLSAELVPQDASGQVHRVAARFALVATAGELATAAGLTGWAPGESERAARACFTAWLNARGGAGNGEVAAMLRQVRRFLELHGEGRFTWWHRAADDHNAKTLNRAGFRRMVNEHGEPIKTNADHQRAYGEQIEAIDAERTSVEFFILNETFKNEVCQGFDPQAVCKVLEQHGCLTTKEPGRHSKPTRLPGLGLVRCYHISPRIFAVEL